MCFSAFLLTSSPPGIQASICWAVCAIIYRGLPSSIASFFPIHLDILPHPSPSSIKFLAIMQLQLLLLSSLACLSSSMITRPFGPHTLAYFESLGGRYGMVRKFRENMATCKDYDIDSAVMPLSDLPSPTAGSKVLTVAIGTGTQV